MGRNKSHSIKTAVMTDEEVYNALLEAANQGGGGGGGGGGDVWPETIICQKSLNYTVPYGYKAMILACPSYTGDIIHQTTINGSTGYFGAWTSANYGAIRPSTSFSIELFEGAVISGNMMYYIALRLI